MRNAKIICSYLTVGDLSAAASAALSCSLVHCCCCYYPAAACRYLHIADKPTLQGKRLRAERISREVK